MSFERGLAAINLEMTDKIPHTEYISHRQYIKQRTGLDIDNPQEAGKAGVEISRVLDFDFIWSVFGYNWGVPEAWMGRARYGESETLREKHYDITTVEEVLNYDAMEMATNIPDMDTLTEAVRNNYVNGQATYPFAVYPGGFYQSVFTWHIQSFGWDLFLEAAAVDMERFDKVMESFFKLTEMVVEAHIRAEVPYFLCHDDIVWASGSVFRPDWMRRYVFPRMKRMWAPLKEAGIKVLFCSDGNFTEYIDDIAEAGAEGFIFEPLTDLNYIVERYGKTHVIVGNADCRVLMSDKPEAIRAEVKRCMDLGRDCPGFMMAVGNHIPFNIPISAVECYFEAYEDMSKR